jgi:hypothetical protein
MLKATYLYRVTNGFASIYGNNPVHMVFVKKFQTESAAYKEVNRLCGTTFKYDSMWQSYHRGHYIFPYLTKGFMRKVNGVLQPKPGVIQGSLPGKGNKAPLSTQYVIVIEDHEDAAEQQFPWGQKYVKP